MLLAEVLQNSIKRVVFFFHLLVMAAALFGFPRSNVSGHDFENLLESPQLLFDEVMMVDL